MTTTARNLRGIIAMVIGMAAFVINDALVKLVREEWETGQILAVRGAFALVLLILWFGTAGRYRQVMLIADRVVAMRALLESVVAILFISALGQLALADITAILMLAPLIITGLSMAFFGEKVGWRRWLAVAVGFAGMLLVIQPGGNAMPFWPAMMAIASAVCVALRDSATRLMPPRVTALAATMATTLATTATGLALANATGTWKPLSFAAAWPLAAAAIFVLIANVAMIEAHRDVDLSVVSPFRFSVIVWAVLLGIVVFGEWPTPLALGGIVLIAGSGLYTLHREQARRREMTEK